MASAESLKQIAYEAIDKEAENLNKISQEIWCKPELNFEEHHAHDVLTSYLQEKGFQVERKYKLDTAFSATVGVGHPHVAVICEYDALPEIGHACGHNLIAEVGVAAGIGIKAAIEAAGQPIGKVTVLGTPAEEGGGGKVALIENDVFAGYDVAMMCHSGSANVLKPLMMARERTTVTYRGRASHAAAFPWEGINALDAAVMCYQSVSCLRQQMKPTWRVHGIIKHGGVKPNIIPEEAVLEYYIRAPTRKELNILKEKMENCFECAAKGTGCTVEYSFSDSPYLNVINNMTLANCYKDNAQSVGVDFDSKSQSDLPLGSTDMGNVSYEVPSIHPFFYIGTDEAIHTRDFTAAAGDKKAQPYTLMQGKALAMTALDVLLKDSLLKQIKTEFENEPMRKE